MNSTANNQNIHPSQKLDRTTHLLLVFCLILCGVFWFWAYFGELDVVSYANGRVIPSSKVKKIQHLEGGIINEIMVNEGDSVTAEQPLLVLEGIVNNASVKELEVRIAALQVDVIRLKAMLNDQNSLSFSGNISKNYPEIIKQAKELFVIQTNRHLSELSSHNEFINQKAQDINGIKSRIRNNNNNLVLLQKQVEISNNLLTDQLTTEYKHLSLLRDQSNLISKIEEDTLLVKRTDSQLAEAREKHKQINHNFKEKASEDLKKNTRDLNEFTQRLKKFKDTQRRTIIRSPVNGIVKTIYIVTKGGIISPGKVIMDIVPTGDSLVVEASLPIQDIGYVQEGQDAIIKLSSPDARRYSELKGKVINISPDAIVDPDGNTYYAAQVKTEKHYFESNANRYKLIPGMLVAVYIHTGKRTVLQYLLDPFIDTLGQSLQER